MATPSLISVSSNLLTAGGVGSTLIVNHNVPVGTTITIVGAAVNDGNQSNQPINSVYLASVLMTIMTSVQGGGDTRVGLWYTLNPPTGNTSILLKYNSNNYVGAGVMSFNNTATTAPTISKTSIGTAASVTLAIVPTVDNSTIIDVLSCESNPSIVSTGSPTQSSVWGNFNQSFQFGRGSAKMPITPAASATLGWTNLGGNRWTYAQMVIDGGGSSSGNVPFNGTQFFQIMGIGT